MNFLLEESSVLLEAAGHQINIMSIQEDIDVLMEAEGADNTAATEKKKNILKKIITVIKQAISKAIEFITNIPKMIKDHFEKRKNNTKQALRDRLNVSDSHNSELEKTISVKEDEVSALNDKLNALKSELDKEKHESAKKSKIMDIQNTENAIRKAKEIIANMNKTKHPELPYNKNKYIPDNPKEIIYVDGSEFTHIYDARYTQLIIDKLADKHMDFHYVVEDLLEVMVDDSDIEFALSGHQAFYERFKQLIDDAPNHLVERPKYGYVASKLHRFEKYQIMEDHWLHNSCLEPIAKTKGIITTIENNMSRNGLDLGFLQRRLSYCRQLISDVTSVVNLITPFFFAGYYE